MNPFYLKELGSEGSLYPLINFMNIGSDKDCQLTISDDSISERHCRIEMRDDKILIKDMRSKSGTFVNECQIIESYLKVGDNLRLGDREFTLIDKTNENNKSQMLQSKNQTLQKTYKHLISAAPSQFPILLLGPSGTGKDVLAQSIHTLSKRKNSVFVCVNCSALSESLIESELFGHIKGSFTGATNDRKGAFESARGGTLFLDEIGDLSIALQAKLLRALENNEIRPVGSDRTVKTDVRIIAATHQNLFEKIKTGEFRSDLFYRLNVVTINTPALNERMEDFESLVYTFAKIYRVQFSFDAIEQLKKYPWPGNIRELKNFIARLSVTYPAVRIETQHITESLNTNIQMETASVKFDKETLKLPLKIDMQSTVTGVREYEKQLIIKKLILNNGNQRRTATDLGMPKSTLHDRIKVYGIDLKKIRERTLNHYAQSLSESMVL